MEAQLAKLAFSLLNDTQRAILTLAVKGGVHNYQLDKVTGRSHGANYFALCRLVDHGILFIEQELGAKMNTTKNAHHLTPLGEALMNGVEA